MNLPISTHRRADALSFGVLLITLGILLFTRTWWPWILVGVGAALMTRQYFLERYYDIFITFIIFGGLFCFSYFVVNWTVVLSVLFTLAGIFIIFREYFYPNNEVGEKKSEIESLEVSEEEHDQEKKP